MVNLPEFNAVNLPELNGANGFTFRGIGPGDETGFSLSFVGDVNNDGFDDVVIGAPYADPPGRENGGVAFIVYGSAGDFEPGLALSDRQDENITLIRGLRWNDYFGAAIDGGGDINGDGIDDFLVSAARGKNAGETARGKSFIVFGQDDGFGQTFDLSTLDGDNGFVVSGIIDGLGGKSASFAGDVNGDGFEDVFISGQGHAGLPTTGAVIFGKAGGFDPDINIWSIPPGDGFLIVDDQTQSNRQPVVAGARDFNGDGLDDLIYRNALNTYVVYGSRDPQPAIVNLSTLDGANGFKVLTPGYQNGFIPPTNIDSAGDVNGDGFDDILIGVHNPTSQRNEVVVVYGTDDAPAVIDAAALAGSSDGFVYSQSGKVTNIDSVASSVGDVNNDGFDDILFGSPDHDGDAPQSGESHLLFGDENGFRGHESVYFTHPVLNAQSGHAFDGGGDFNGDGIDDFLIGAPGANDAHIVFGNEFGIFDGLVLQLEADQGVETENGVITAWRDQSGYDNDLTRVTSDPTLIENRTPSGAAAISFDGQQGANGDSLSRAGQELNGLPTGNQERTVFFVADYIRAKQVYSGVSYGDGAANEAFGLVTNGRANNLTVQGWGTENDQISNTQSGDNQGSDEWIVQSAVLEDGVIRQFLNGTLIDSNQHDFATDLSSPTSQLLLGGEIAGLGFSEYDVGAVLVFDRALSEAERYEVENYLFTKYISPDGDDNAPPAIVNLQPIDAPADQPIFFNARDGLLSYGQDPERDIIAVASVQGAPVSVGAPVATENGVIRVYADGVFDYTPNPGFIGADQFDFSLSDGSKQTSATLQLNVDAHPLVTQPDALRTVENRALVTHFSNFNPSLLDNDQHLNSPFFKVSHINGDAIESGQEIQLANGVLVIERNGELTYTPNVHFIGTETFTYRATDGVRTSASTTAVITVNPLQRGAAFPTPVPTYETAENQGLSVTNPDEGLFGGAAFFDINDPLELNREQAAFGEPFDLTHGSIVINPDGTFDYDPFDDAFGVDHLRFFVDDDVFGSFARNTNISIASDTPAAPAADDDFFYAGFFSGEFSPQQNLLRNDTDENLDELTVTAINGAPVTPGDVIALENGLLRVGVNGFVDFTAEPGWAGEQTLTYEVSDPGGLTDTAQAIFQIYNTAFKSISPITDGLVVSLESEGLDIPGEGAFITGWLDTNGGPLTLNTQGFNAPLSDIAITPTGRAAVSFDGASQAFVADGDLSFLPDGNDDRTIFVVVDYLNTNGVSAGVVYGDGAQNEAFGLVADGVNAELGVQGWGFRNDFSSNVSAGDNQGDDEWFVHSAVLDDDILTQFVNGDLVSTDTHVFNTDVDDATSQFLIGAEIAGLGLSELEIAAVLIFDRALTADEREEVEDYLYEKYIEATLPTLSDFLV